jgi:hypothetical protein
MNTQTPTESNPQRHQPRVSPGSSRTSVPAEPAKPGDESEELDQLRRNPVSEGSNYGFGTPAEGFGPKRQRTDHPKNPKSR